MADVPDRVERVLDLLKTLLETTRVLSREEIFERFRPIGAYPDSPEAARRAFERDKETLRELGVPIHTEPMGDGSITGYRVKPDEYYLPDLGLDADETIALRVALNAVDLGLGSESGALLKIGTAPGGTASPIAAIPSAPALPELFEAMRRSAVVGFVHRGSVRTLEPYGFAVRKGRWYVVGRDVDRDAIRAFRADRVEGAVRIGEAGGFRRPEGFVPGDHIEERAWMFGSGPGTTVRIAADPTVRESVLRDLGDDALSITEQADGGVEVEITVTVPGALRTHLLGYLDAVEILGPPAERDAMLERLSAIVAAR